uniref:Transmembrane protein n=1 Tax=Glossina palpalis gambiensis TaxID=67801 RepID=A0A1B0B9S8_9MUSC
MPRTIRKPHKSVSGDSNNNGCKRSMTIKVCNFEFVGVGALCLFVCLLLLLLLLCLPIKKHPQKFDVVGIHKSFMSVPLAS